VTAEAAHLQSTAAVGSPPRYGSLEPRRNALRQWYRTAPVNGEHGMADSSSNGGVAYFPGPAMAQKFRAVSLPRSVGLFRRVRHSDFEKSDGERSEFLKGVRVTLPRSFASGDMKTQTAPHRPRPSIDSSPLEQKVAGDRRPPYVAPSAPCPGFRTLRPILVPGLRVKVSKFFKGHPIELCVQFDHHVVGVQMIGRYVVPRAVANRSPN
jgi:hypothetical protein